MQNSMYTSAMESFWLIEVCPYGGMLAGRLLGNRGGYDSYLGHRSQWIGIGLQRLWVSHRNSCLNHPVTWYLILHLKIICHVPLIHWNLLLLWRLFTCELDESGAILNSINNNLTKKEIEMSLTLEERQPRTGMEITSADYGETVAVITAEGNMG